MEPVVSKQLQVHGERLGKGLTYILDEVYIFKGKLRAAAIRAKPDDGTDLAYLESVYRNKLHTCAGQFSQYYAGLALKRYPDLMQVFERVGVDVETAAKRVEGLSLEALPPPQHGDVKNGLLG
jgi:hypothetical protein